MRHVLLFSLLVACGATPVHTTHAESDDRAAITAVLDDFHDAAAHSDEARYFAHFTDDGVFLGTDATERWDVTAFRAYAHPHFEAGRGWVMQATHRDIVVRGDVAWFDEALDTENMGLCRGSGVLLRVGETNTWKIAQYNLSIPIPNALTDDVVERIRKEK